MLRRVEACYICAIILCESRTNVANRILEATGTPERCHGRNQEMGSLGHWSLVVDWSFEE